MSPFISFTFPVHNLCQMATPLFCPSILKPEFRSRSYQTGLKTCFLSHFLFTTSVKITTIYKKKSFLPDGLHCTVYLHHRNARKADPGHQSQGNGAGLAVNGVCGCKVGYAGWLAGWSINHTSIRSINHAPRTGVELTGVRYLQATVLVILCGGMHDLRGSLCMSVEFLFRMN